MIVAETADRYRFVTQPDHADLAGQFAEHWGNDDVDRPDPFDAAVAAAYTHDTGWTTYDLAPRPNGDGTPIDFRDMPAAVWVDLYDDGIDAVVDADAYAGLLVSMHGAGLRNQRYGLSPSWPETPEPFADFVAREEARQTRLLEELRDGDGIDLVSEADENLLSELHGSGRTRDGRGSRLWTNYKRLQAWDALSLAFCITASPPGYDEVGNVPLDDETDATLSIDPVGDDEFRIDPYPFDESPLIATVPARTVEKDAFDDAESPARAYYAAGRETLQFTFRPSE